MIAKRHIRKANRFRIDVTDEDQRMIELHQLAVCGAGRPGFRPMRETIPEIFSVMRSSCPCRLPPNDLPARNRVSSFSRGSIGHFEIFDRRGPCAYL
jgi:hypothetical protein